MIRFSQPRSKSMRDLASFRYHLWIIINIRSCGIRLGQSTRSMRSAGKRGIDWRLKQSRSNLSWRCDRVPFACGVRAKFGNHLNFCLRSRLSNGLALTVVSHHGRLRWVKQTACYFQHLHCPAKICAQCLSLMNQHIFFLARVPKLYEASQQQPQSRLRIEQRLLRSALSII